MCSARSLGCAASAAHLAPVIPGAATARTGAGDRARVDLAPRHAHQPLGRGAQRSPRPGTAPAPQRAPDSPARSRRVERCRDGGAAAGAHAHVPVARQVRLVDVAGAHVLLGARARARDSACGSSSCTASTASASAPSDAAAALRASASRRVQRRLAPGLGGGAHAAAAEFVHQGARGAQREGTPGERRRRQLQVRFDLLRQLVAQKQRPAAVQRQAAPGSAARAVLSARHQCSSASRKLAPAGAHAAAAKGVPAALRAQGRARQASSTLAALSGPCGGAVEQQRIACRVARGQRAQHLRRDGKLADEQARAWAGTPRRRTSGAEAPEDQRAVGAAEAEGVRQARCRSACGARCWARSRGRSPDRASRS